MADGDVLVVPPAVNVDLAIAPALADQARNLETPPQIELDAQIRLGQRDRRRSGAIGLADHQFVGPDALPLLAGEALAIDTLIAALLDLGLGKAVQSEGAEIYCLAGGACRQACDQQRTAHGLAPSRER